MSMEHLPNEQWRTYLDELSNAMKGLQVEIEVSGRDIGDQIEARGARLVGITYDTGDDLLEVAVEGHVHVLRKPQAIAVDKEGGRVRCVAATDPMGRTHEVHFRQAAGRLEG